MLRSVSQLVTTYDAVCTLYNVIVEKRRHGFLSCRRRTASCNGETNATAGADGDGRPGGGDSEGDGTSANGTAAAGAPAPVGGSAAAAGAGTPGGGGFAGGGGVTAALDNIDPVGDAPPGLNAVDEPRAAGTAAVFDAWAQTENSAECESHRDDLTVDIYRDRGELLAPYIG
eukprot:TRINITY_DN3440_c0_g1_i3.p1 TRINITY_DN3440_c0_g1~~TRINITY_DN3440_c0_g1_i3.p1  ORF type:complete len:172 (-),score=13.82 TRINITY_DN3440_c0_g1_i3:107-622(-)